MEFRLKGATKDKYPICGFFVESTEIKDWFAALEQVSVSSQLCQIFPISGLKANSVWGCLVMCELGQKKVNLRNLTSAHTYNSQLIIPEKMDVHPVLGKEDIRLLFSSRRYVMHPDFGLYELEEPMDVTDYLNGQDLEEKDTLAPIKFEGIDHRIKSYRIEAKPKEDLAMELKDQISTERKKINTKPLNLSEKARLKVYKQFFKSKEGENGRTVEVNTNAQGLQKWASKFGFNSSDAIEKMKQDFADLEERNKKEVDKLMDMLKNNPEEALRYAIPLDEHGYSRSQDTGGDFKLTDRGLNLSLFGGLLAGLGGSGGSVSLGEEFFKLQDQYRKTAAKLNEDGKYDEAAYIYMRLLKDYHSAANCLKRKGEYDKAAMIFLEYAKNEIMAAQCYEEGKMYDKAIELYEKKKRFEKAGDLFVKLGKPHKAMDSYQKVVDDYLSKSMHIPAANLIKQKMHNFEQCQHALLQGWRSHKDQVSCLNLYFSNIEKDDDLLLAIKRIKQQELNNDNERRYLTVLKYTFSRRDQIRSEIRDIAYEMVSGLLKQNKIKSRELLAFNTKDKRLREDTMRYDTP